MLKANSHYFNTYAFSFKQQRLIIPAFFIIFCLTFLNCSKNPSSKILPVQNKPEISETAVNINTADPEKLEKLPRVGKDLARKIIEHREKYGAFRRAEDLILIQGMSDKKFREIKSLVKVE